VPKVARATLLLLLACHGGTPHAAQEDGVARARVLVAALDESSRRSLLLPLGAPDRTQWRRDPSPRPGLMLQDLPAEPSRLLRELLATVLSERGLDMVDAIRKEQEALGRDESGLGPGYYWLAIYGEPGTGEWAWRLGGHHVSLHFAYDGATLRSSTPLMLGGEAESDDASVWTGHARLLGRETMARSLARSLAPASWESARIGVSTPGDLELSEAHDAELTVPDRGVELARLDAAQQRAVAALVREYLSVLREPLALSLMRQFEATAEQARFAWAGGLEDGAPHYYRVQAPGFLIEYTSSGMHMHTLLRTADDFGSRPPAR
jgi:hypothetical protein